MPNMFQLSSRVPSCSSQGPPHPSSRLSTLQVRGPQHRDVDLPAHAPRAAVPARQARFSSSSLFSLLHPPPCCSESRGPGKV